MRQDRHPRLRCTRMHAQQEHKTRSSNTAAHLYGLPLLPPGEAAGMHGVVAPVPQRGQARGQNKAQAEFIVVEAAPLAGEEGPAWPTQTYSFTVCLPEHPAGPLMGAECKLSAARRWGEAIPGQHCSELALRGPDAKSALLAFVPVWMSCNTAGYEQGCKLGGVYRWPSLCASRSMSSSAS